VQVDQHYQLIVQVVHLTFEFTGRLL